MKTLTVLAAIFVVNSASGYLIKVPDAPLAQQTLAPSGWIHLQKLVLPLFENVCEISNDPTIVRLSQDFEQNVLQATDFWDVDAVTNFQNFKRDRGCLAKGEIFSEYNPDHVFEVRVMFGLLYNAKNFDTFYKIAAWARQNLNCGLYVNAIYLSFEKRRDTEKLTLPAPYEILPNYFIRKDVIIQGSSLLAAGQDITVFEGLRDEGNAYTLDANYTANFHDSDDESKLAYFREDIGINSFYFLKMLYYAPWLNTNVDINSRYGENMYYMMKQLMARYNMERYSNGMGEQDKMDWDALPMTPYDPMLVYSNGNEFIHRSVSADVTDDSNKVMLRTIENNLSTVVSHMRENGYNKTQILNHLMEILVTGEKSYDTLARQLLGKVLSNNGDPSVLEHYMTSLRDPLFWKINKNMVDLIDNALKILPPYAKNELYFPGVEVVNIEVKKIMTSFDYFQFDITDALKIGNGDTTFRVKIGQTRLNHKPFTVKVNISSLVTQKGLVKVYIGPKIMPGEFAKKKNQFGLLDCFEINLKRGSNVITRSSDAMKMYSPDFMSYRTLIKKVQDAEFGLDSLPLNSIEQQIQYPLRMIIPKGSPEGLPFQILVFVAPFMKSKIVDMYSVAQTEFNSAILSPSYPLDLNIEDNTILDLPNILMREMSIMHKSSGGGGGSAPARPNTASYGTRNAMDYTGNMNDVNAFGYNSDPTYHNTNVYSVQGDDSAVGTKKLQSSSAFDYKSKKKFDYKDKRTDYKKEVVIDSSKKIDNIIHSDPLPYPSSNDNNVIEPKYIIIDSTGAQNKPQNPVDFNTDNEPFNIHYYDVEQGDDSSVVSTSQSRPSYDYKAKRPQYKKYNKPDYTANRVDYKTIYKTRTTTIETPIDTNVNEITEKVLNFDYDKPKNDIENGMVVEDTINVDHTKTPDNVKVFEYINKDDDHFRVIPILKLNMPQKKAFTVYDFIYRILNDDDDVSEEDTTVDSKTTTSRD